MCSVALHVDVPNMSKRQQTRTQMGVDQYSVCPPNDHGQLFSCGDISNLLSGFPSNGQPMYRPVDQPSNAARFFKVRPERLGTRVDCLVTLPGSQRTAKNSSLGESSHGPTYQRWEQQKGSSLEPVASKF